MKRLFFSLSFLFFFILGAHGQCKVNFTFESPNPMDLFLVQFYDISDSTINQWFWDFGENETSSDNKKDPQYKYKNPGSYVVTLIGYDTISNCFKVARKPIEIPGLYKSCKANFKIDSVDFNLFQFRDTSIFSSTGKSKKSWYWDFGDGENSFLKDPFHTYTKGGQYNVCLKIIDSNTNCIDSICKKVFAFKCEANFYAQKDTIGNTIRFIPQFSQGYNATKIKWNFGDGDSTSVLAPYHTYRDTGTYLVCLYTQNSNICIDTVCQYIQINSIKDCYFDFNIRQNKNQLTFSIDTLKRRNDFYAWDFGDGNVDTGLTVSLTYAGGGKFSVCANSKLSSINCIYSLCKTIDIKKEKIINSRNPGIRNSRIVPNPIGTINKLEIEKYEGESFEIEVFDILGKKLFTELNLEKKDFFINLPNLARGSYFYQVFNKSELISKGKFIIL